MALTSGTLRIKRWHDPCAEGRSQWYFCRADDVKFGLTLPDDRAMLNLWSAANPSDGLKILGRFPWGCLLEMPAGIKKKRREEYRALIEEHESTQIVQ